MIEISLKIANKKEIVLPVDEESFNPQSPIVVKLLREGKVKVFTLRMTNKRSLCLN
jgi:hypothetical protein